MPRIKVAGHTLEFLHCDAAADAAYMPCDLAQAGKPLPSVVTQPLVGSNEENSRRITGYRVGIVISGGEASRQTLCKSRGWRRGHAGKGSAPPGFEVYKSIGTLGYRSVTVPAR